MPTPPGPRIQRPYTNVMFFNGGMGATAGGDGEPVLSWPSNISSTPVEIAERNSPLFFHEKRMIPGSGGAGKFRGGLGQEMRIENESRFPRIDSVLNPVQTRKQHCREREIRVA